MQVINDPYRSFGSSFGANVGAGLGAGLEQLAQHKLNEVLQNKQIKLQQAQQHQMVQQRANFWEQAGLPKQASFALAQQDPALQKAFLDRLEGATFGAGEQQQSQPVQQLQQPQIRNVNNVQNAPQVQPSNIVENNIPRSESRPSKPEQLIKKIEEAYSPKIAKQIAKLPENAQNKAAQQLLNQYAQQQLLKSSIPVKQPQVLQNNPASQPQQVQQVPVKQQNIVPAPQVNPVQEVGGLRLGASPQERRHRETLEEKKLGREQKREMGLLTHFGKQIEKVNAARDSAESSNENIDLARQKLQQGNVDSQSYLTFLKGAGLEDVDSLLSSDTQVVNKAIASEVKGLKDVFGSNVAVGEVERFMKTLPNLLQDPQTVSDLFNVIKHKNDALIAKAEIQNQVIEENGGVPPVNLNSLVDARYKPVKKQLGEQFSSDLKRVLTESEKRRRSSNAGTASLSYFGGKALKNLPRAAAGLAAGAAAGSALPVVGTTAGALLGGLAGLSGLGVKDLLPY